MAFKSYYKLLSHRPPTRNCVGAQGTLHSDPGPRHHGPGVVSGRCLGVRLERSSTPRKLRSSTWPMRFDQAGRAGSCRPTGKRLHHQLRDRARPRHFRADAQHAVDAERDRCRQAHSLRLPEAQDQQQLVWPASFVWRARTWISWRRSSGLPAPESPPPVMPCHVRSRPQDRRGGCVLSRLATQLNTDALASSDQPEVRMLIAVVNDLGKYPQLTKVRAGSRCLVSPLVLPGSATGVVERL